ncbi:enoyl-CoA hydratase/isomerase family protein [Variovorax paradoxus]|nr:enoyl-CoA hydratase/isomerase family protein [Variovorax paradoxus]
MMVSESPVLQIEGAVATLTLRRPEQHNRIDADDPGVISRHLEDIGQRPEVSVLVVTGSGQKTFCSGYTLGQIGSRLDRSFEDMLDRIEQLEIPTICAMNGSAYGGGTDLAMSCDFRIGVRGSRLFMPAAKFGLHYYPGGLRRFVTRLGPTAAKKIFLTAQTLDAEELLRIGYLTDLVEPEALNAKVQDYVGSILECERAAVRSMKQHIDQLALGAWSEPAGRAAYEGSLRSSATAERLAALGEKRQARQLR